PTQLTRGPASQRTRCPVPSAPAVQCTSCPVHQLSSAPAVQCTSCPVHQLSSAPAVQCTGCPVHQLSSAPAVQCTSCPVHQLSSAPGVQCTRCPAHQVSSAPGDQATRYWGYIWGMGTRLPSGSIHRALGSPHCRLQSHSTPVANPGAKRGSHDLRILSAESEVGSEAFDAA